MNIHWIAGFINANGSLGLFSGIYCQFRILITQHNNILILLQAICKFLGLGKVYLGTNLISTFKIFNLKEVNSFNL